MPMKLLWIAWAGGIETRDDGWTIYRDVRWAILRSPDGQISKHRTAGEAKKTAEGVRA